MLDLRPRALRDVRLVEDGSAQRRIGAQDPDEQRPVAAADVGDRAEGREVVRVRDRGRGLRREGRHRPVEQRGARRVLRHLGERIRIRVGPAERRLPRAHAVLEILPAVLDGNAGEEQHGRVHRAGNVGAQQLPERRGGEPAVRLLLEDAAARQQAQHAAQRWRVGSAGAREVVVIARAVREQVGDSQRRGEGERTRQVVTDRHLVEREARRLLARLRGSRTLSLVGRHRCVSLRATGSARSLLVNPPTRCQKRPHGRADERAAARGSRVRRTLGRARGLAALGGNGDRRARSRAVRGRAHRDHQGWTVAHGPGQPAPPRGSAAQARAGRRARRRGDPAADALGRRAGGGSRRRHRRSASTSSSPSCTAPTARTAPSRACSTSPTFPTSAPGCSPRASAWTRRR